MPASTSSAAPLTSQGIWTLLSQRPLVTLAPMVMAGCAFGLGQQTSGARPWPGADPYIETMAAAVFCLAAVWLVANLNKPRWAGLVVASAVLFSLFGWSAARRTIPAANDIAWLVRARPVPRGPQVAPEALLRGKVAGSVQVSDFGIGFPLQVVSCKLNGRSIKGSGFISMQAPAGVTIETGDELALRATITDLPRIDNLGQRDDTAKTLLDRCWCVGRVAKAEDIRVVRRHGGGWLQNVVTGFGAGIADRFEHSFVAAGRPYPHATAQLLAAMTFGQGTLGQPLPLQAREAFRSAGLTHLLVASGQQIAIIVVILIGIGRLFGLRRKWLVVLVLPPLVLFALVSGSSASIWRAVIGGVCLTWALMAGRDTDGLSLWSLALVALLVIDPLQLHDIGFQLTFAATWGLLVLSPRLMAWLKAVRLDHAFTELMAASLSAQLATTPLLLYHFGRLSVGGIGANVVAVPLAGLLVGAGLWGLVCPPINVVGYVLTTAIADTAFATARLGGAAARAQPVGLGAVLVFFIILISMSLPSDLRSDLWTMLSGDFRRWRKRATAKLAGRGWMPTTLVALALLFVVTGAQLWRIRHPVLRVTLLDVGQGESIVIIGPTGNTAIIDGGSSNDEGRGDVGATVIAPYLQSVGVRRINAMFVTHADSDHCNGLKAVMHEVPVDLAVDGASAIAGQTYAEEPDYLELRDAWSRQGVKVVPAAAGTRFDLGGGATLTMLAPMMPPLQGDNDNGEVIRLDYGSTSCLFTADIEAPAEERLLQSGANLGCTLLKVGHHGSKTSSTPEFLEAAHPKIAVISCGRYNQFGHPAAQTLERLARCGAATFRTDRDGAIEFSTDGTRSWVTTVH